MKPSTSGDSNIKAPPRFRETKTPEEQINPFARDTVMNLVRASTHKSYINLPTSTLEISQSGPSVLWSSIHVLQLASTQKQSMIKVARHTIGGDSAATCEDTAQRVYAPVKCFKHTTGLDRE